MFDLIKFLWKLFFTTLLFWIRCWTKPEKRIDGCHVLVSGAASGIGKAVVELLVAEGCIVYVTDVVQNGIDELHKQYPQQVKSYLMDVSDVKEIAKVYKQIEASGNTLEALVNCAGVSHMGIQVELDFSEVQKLFSINTFGPHHVIKQFYPLLKKPGATIVNVTSGAAYLTCNFQGYYSASKAALRYITDALRMELAPFGVRVVQVEPTQTETPIWEKQGASGNLKKYTDSPFWPQVVQTNLFLRTLRTTAVPANVVAKEIVHSIKALYPKSHYFCNPNKLSSKLVYMWLPCFISDLLLKTLFRNVKPPAA